MFRFGKKHEKDRPPRVAVVLKRNSGVGRVQVFYHGEVLILEVKPSTDTGGWTYHSSADSIEGYVSSRAEAIAQGVAELVALHS